MNKIHKFLFASFVALGMTLTFQCYDVEAASRYSGKAWVEAPASSGAITGYTKGCAVTAVFASSESASIITDWFVLIATNATENIVGVASFAAADYRSPALTFPVSTITTNGYMPQVYKVIDYGEEGISFSSAPYVYKTAATSGQSQRVWLEIIP